MRNSELILRLVTTIQEQYELRLLAERERYNELLAKYEETLLDHPIVNDLVKCANELDQVKELSNDPRGFQGCYVDGEEVNKDVFDQILADASNGGAGGGGYIPFKYDSVEISAGAPILVETQDKPAPKPKSPKEPKVPRDTFHNKCTRCKLPKPSRWLDKETGVCTTCKKNEGALSETLDRIKTAEPAKYVRTKIVPVPPRNFEAPKQRARKVPLSIKELHEELLTHFRDTSTFSIDTVMEFAGCDLGQARAFMAEMVTKQAAQKIPGASERFRIKVRANMDDYWGLTMPSRESGHVEF